MERLGLCLLAVAAVILGAVHAQRPMQDRARCMLACRPGEFLHPTECRCFPFGELPDVTSGSTTRDPPPKCTPRRCPLTFVPCSQYHVDSEGCETCRCRCRPFSLSCPTECKYGTEYKQDSNGCKVCVCAAQPKPEVPRRRCPPTCAIYCPFGHILDTEGCPTCACESGDGLPW